MLKILISYELALFLLTLASINPSQSIWLSLLAVPGVYSAVPMSQSKKRALLSLLLLILPSPLGISLWMECMKQLELFGWTQSLESRLIFQSFLNQSREFFNVFGSMLFPSLFIVYWPLVLSTVVIIGN